MGIRAQRFRSGPGVRNITSGGCGVAFKVPPHCPRLQGSLASRAQNNVGSGLNPLHSECSNACPSDKNIMLQAQNFKAEIEEQVVMSYYIHASIVKVRRTDG